MVHSRDALIPGGDLSALIARLEAAETGSHELDKTVAVACGSTIQVWAETASDGTFLGSVRPYSTSLDAALALAERISWRVWSIDMSIAGRASVLLQSLEDRPGKDPETGAYMIGKDFSSGSARTPALALCIAILKAKAQGEGG